MVTHIAALVGRDLPPEIEYLALGASTWPTVGRFAVEERGFRLVDLKPGVVALLARVGPVPDVSSLARAPVCEAPITRWPELGLSVCSVGRYNDARALVVVMRDGPPEKAGPVVVVGETPSGPLRFLGYDGVFNAEQLPVGKAMRLLARAPLEALPMTLRAGRVGEDLGTPIDVTVPAL